MAGPEGQTGPQRPWREKWIQAGHLGWTSLIFPSVKIEAQGPPRMASGPHSALPGQGAQV